MSNIVGIERDRVTNVSSTDFPGYDDVDRAWSLDRFKQTFDLKLHHLDDTEMNFDLMGLDASVANAFRRIMIAEIPTVAFETINVYNNTSILHDEVLAQRIGLVPINIDPDSLAWYDPSSTTVGDDGEIHDGHVDMNTVVFTLKVKCERNSKGEVVNSNVYARDLQFSPRGEQTKWMSDVHVLNPDILLAKLAPGQEIELTALAILGLGSDHAKFSPVATASYRMMPVIDIVGEPIRGELARKFQSCFPPGVVEIRGGEAVVMDPRRDTVSREVLRHKEFEGRVKLGRRRDHFIFNVESTGAMRPEEIFVKAISSLRNRCNELLQYDLE